MVWKLQIRSLCTNERDYPVHNIFGPNYSKSYLINDHFSSHTLTHTRRIKLVEIFIVDVWQEVVQIWTVHRGIRN